MHRIVRIGLGLALQALPASGLLAAPLDCSDGIGATPDACAAACCCTSGCLCEAPEAPTPQSSPQATLPATPAAPDAAIQPATVAAFGDVPVLPPPVVAASAHPRLDHSEKALSRLRLLQI